jgi:hypothetical protein
MLSQSVFLFKINLRNKKQKKDISIFKYWFISMKYLRLKFGVECYKLHFKFRQSQVLKVKVKIKRLCIN